MKVYTDIDLKKNELQYAVIHPLSSAPTGVLGQIYYNSTDKHLYQHDGTNWVRVGITYDLEADSAVDAVILKLVGDNGTIDTVRLVGDNGTTITQSGQEITISSSDTNTTYTFSGTASPTNYVITITPSTGTAQTITLSLADATNAGLMSPADFTKLSGIEDGAQVNPNNFSEVVVDSTPISASDDNDTFTLEAGANITLTPDTVNKKATISASNTSYPTGTSADIEGGSSTTPSVWSAQTLHDYVDQKTSEIDIGYSCEEDTTELTSETITTDPEGDYGWGALTYSDAILADRLLVVFDGVSYIVDKSDDGEYSYYGAPADGTDFSEYPFGIQSDMLGDENYIATENSGTFDITISTYDTAVDTTECFEEAVRSVSGGGGGGSKSTYFGYSDTSGNTSVKAVTSDDFPYTGDSDIPIGTIIGIRFNYGNTTASPELAINGGYSISINVGSASANSGTNTLKWSDSAMLYFMYTSNVWELISVATKGVEAPRGAYTWYGTCDTSASTAAKVVTAPNYVLTKGSMVVVNFTTSNTANSPTLNVNGTGAKSIYYHGDLVSQTNPLIFTSQAILTFMYDGYGYQYVSADNFIHTASISIVTSDWNNNTATKSIAAVQDNSKVIITPAPSSMANYVSAGIYCSAQSWGTLTFTCTTTPTSTVWVNALII